MTGGRNYAEAYYRDKLFQLVSSDRSGLILGADISYCRGG